MSSNFSTQDQDGNSKVGGQEADGSLGSGGGSFVSSIYQPGARQNDNNSSANKPGNANQGEGEEAKVNLWYQLLQNVGLRGQSKQAHLLLLGDKGSGKRCLIKAMNKPFLRQMGLQQNIFDEIGSDYSAFESSYLYIRELTEYGVIDGAGGQQIGTDETMMSRLNVWIINDEEMGKMIPKVLKPEDLEHTFAFIVPDLEQPWDLMRHCEKWMKVLKDAVYSISPNLNLKTLDKLRDKTVDLYKTYEEPEFDKEGKFINKKIINKIQKKGDMDESKGQLEDFDASLMEDQEMIDDLRKEMDLPAGTLETNLFIPTAVVCSKVDLVEHGDKEIKGLLEKNLDFIQYSLRKYCLTYGTSLLFVSSNSNCNIQLAYDYILHRLYDQEFPHASNINDKEALFVPTGFDSIELIDQSDLRSFQLKTNAAEPTYDEVVMKPERTKNIPVPERDKVKNCPDWKTQLEQLYIDKQERQATNQTRQQQKFNPQNPTQNKFKPGPPKLEIDAKPTPNLNPDALRQSIQPGAGQTLLAAAADGANPRMSLQPAQTPKIGGDQTLLPQDGGQQQPGSTRNTDSKKSEKVKNFYSSLLKKKDDKHRQSINKMPAGVVGAPAQAPAQIPPKEPEAKTE